MSNPPVRVKRFPEWRPSEPAAYAPLFVWPPQPRDLTKWIFGWPGYLFPWPLVYAALAVGVWRWLTPSSVETVDFTPRWVTLVLIRNLALLWLSAGTWHLLLYTWRVEGDRKRYNPNPLGRGGRFTLGTQLRDNIFWSCISGVPVWTAWEVVFLHGYAVGWLPAISWQQQPVYVVALALLVPIWQDVHFYFVHRALHWPPLYRWVHSLHHRNVNVGPWSGISMHPVEHVLYFSNVAIFALVPAHPYHVLVLLLRTALMPAQGHAGFHGKVFRDIVPTGSYFHWLHHRYFNCNFGEATVPLDKWFGTFRDGLSDQAVRHPSRVQGHR